MSDDVASNDTNATDVSNMSTKKYSIPLRIPNCVYYDADFLSSEEATEFYTALHADVPWEKTSKINRWVALYEEPLSDGPEMNDNESSEPIFGNNDATANEDPITNDGKTRSAMTKTQKQRCKDSAEPYQYRDAPSQKQKNPRFTETIRKLQQKAQEWYSTNVMNQQNSAATPSDGNNEEATVDGTTSNQEVSSAKAPPILNVCLCNYYEDGLQRIGYHYDREEIGRTTPIVSISLGVTRTFILKSKHTTNEMPYSIELTAGSICVMENSCQHHYVHGIPKQPEVSDGRINLTFRCKTATTDGEIEHTRRDTWLQQITDINTSDAAAAAATATPVEDTTYVFGDAVAEESPESLMLLYSVVTNIGAECYTVAEIREVLDAMIERQAADTVLSLLHVSIRPFDAAGYVGIYYTSDSDQEVVRNEISQTALPSALLELKSIYDVIEYYHTFTLQQVVAAEQEEVTVETLTAEQIYAFYKQRLVQKDSGIPPFETAMNDTSISTKIPFRVTTNRIGGPHLFTGPNIEYEIGGAISEYYERVCEPKMTTYTVNVRVDVIGNVVMIGQQRNVTDLSKNRHFLRFRNSVTIKCNLAYAMLRCGNVLQPQLSASANSDTAFSGNEIVVLDPFCGSGTIVLEGLEMARNNEAKNFRKMRGIGLDVSRRSANGARDNAEAEGFGSDVCEFHCIDARAMRKHVPDNSVDAIVSNLPWGVMTGVSKDVADLQTLYEIFLRTAWYVLKDGGRIVMLVLRGLQLSRIVRKLGGRYRLLRCNVVRTTNNLPCFVVIEKTQDVLNKAIKAQLSYMSQYVNVSKELYHAIRMEDVNDEKRERGNLAEDSKIDTDELLTLRRNAHK